MGIEKALTESHIAVLIDFENVGLSSIQGLFDQLSDIGRIIIKRAYADWSSSKTPREKLFELGIEPILIFRYASRGKNSSDIRLTIDATELLFQSTVDTFVIVSSDTDFVPLINKLRAAGKVVIGAGKKETKPTNLVRSCDRYIFFDQADFNVVPQMSEVTPVDELLVRGVRASVDENGKVLGSKLRPTLQRLDPSFDFRAYGHSTFVKLLEASPVLKIRRPSGGGDVTIELNESFVKTEPKITNLDLATHINDAWAKRASEPGQSIPGPVAASYAAKVLGVSKLSLSKYKTLQRLLDANEELKNKWERNKNMIIRLA